MRSLRMRSRSRAAALVLLGAAGAAAASLLWAVLRGPEPPRTMQERVHAVAASLRCPVCQNLSVADSPSRLAVEMRSRIAADLRAGKSPDEIRAEFVAAYGEWVLQEPPKRGIHLVAWALPAAALGAGVVAVSLFVRRRTAALAGVPPRTISATDRASLDRALAELEEERP